MRITWHNDPKPHGGGFGPVNCPEFPPAPTGVPAGILALVGKWFATGAHEVGATVGGLLAAIVGGQFDAQVIARAGCESNVQEIFDQCQELAATHPDVMILNQFEHPGNYLRHDYVTGRAMQEVLRRHPRPADEFRGVGLTTGSAGTPASGDYLKTLYRANKIAASEALPCPTLLRAGFGGHRIGRIAIWMPPAITSAT